MPQFPNIGVRDFRMDPALFGSEGETTLAGLVMHEAEVDLTNHSSLGVVSYDIFNPLSSFDPLATAKPFLIWFAAFRWELPDTASNGIIVSVGSNAATYDNLVIPNALLDTAQETRGFRVFDQGSLMRKIGGGGGAHWHWLQATTTSGNPSPLGEPIRALVDASVAGVGPYTGKVFFYLLMITLSETLPG